MASEFLSTAIGRTNLDGLGGLVENSFFETLDPAHVRFADWVAAATNAEFIAKGWASAVNGSELHGRDPVETVWYREADQTSLKLIQPTFPMIAVWPSAEAHDDETLSIERVITTWTVQYILGPLTPELHRRLGGAMRGFTKLCKALLFRKFHPAYDSGAVQIFETKLNWSRVQTRSATYGRVIVNDDSLSFYGSTLVLETAERVTETPDDEYGAFVAMGIIANMDGPGGTVDAAMQEDVEWDP